MADDHLTAGSPQAAMPFAEFVVLMAILMGLTALSIDNLLPAFGPIGREFRIREENDLQMIVYVYMISFAVMQIFYGPLSDVYGRRPILLVGLGIYAAGTLMAALAGSFETLLIARAVQGAGVASARVLAVTVVRDQYAGREMARVMSLTMIVFITVPVFAPATGSLILLVGSWRLIFDAMLVLGVGVVVWVWLRLPETLHPEYRMPFSWGRIRDGIGLTATTRLTLGYSTGMALMMGTLMGYIGSAQQILEADVYRLGALFPVAFGAIAGVMGIASLINSQVVRRFGMRRLSHGGLIGFVLMGAVQLAAALYFGGKPPVLLFIVLLASSFFLFSLTVPNFNALAMEPLGAVAGTASSVIGAYTTLVGAIAGLFIGQSFDGTVIPLGAGYCALGLLALGVVLWTERGRLFHGAPVAVA